MIPGRFLIRGDTAIMFSPDGYAEFIRPYDESLLASMGGGAIHFCGDGQHLVVVGPRLYGCPLDGTGIAQGGDPDQRAVALPLRGDAQIGDRHHCPVVSPIPVGGFGWDSHIILPSLVLATRPLAQLARITSVSLTEASREDYVRTAWAKGLPTRHVWGDHLLPNALVPILTALGVSLRFSLGSLPVVEYFFGWPGMGATLMEAVRARNTNLVITLALALGISFMLLNLGLDLAYRLLLNDTFPSWGYSIKHGATTIWERWDGWTAHEGFQDPGMNSFNHYSLGSVGEWMYTVVAGIDLDPEVPGYKRFVLRPRPGGGLTHARGELTRNARYHQYAVHI